MAKYDTMLAFMVFAASRPEVLAQVQALTDAVALEAGEALPDLRETMAVQILSAEAKAQLKTLANFVEVILGKAVIEPDAPSNADVSSLEKYNRMRDFDASPEPSGNRKQSSRKIQALPHRPDTEVLRGLHRGCRCPDEQRLPDENEGLIGKRLGSR
ncbi:MULTISPECIES: hypothetical protein [Pseudomonas]|uniref:hypothetical protein n=1 Tax=Pseudomonas TaxID=286 RepID=UPI000534772B|nr:MULTISPECIES: hypothetical protein [Pseudomonas]KLJ13965.1 hypothetical protein G1E_35685 [Pseudomonas sp. TJI-51]MBA6124447.1 hypothetical protein [Pseudomonas juntendi]MBS6040052.1 hypothetical protein [Pseudomonas sp.]MCF3159660.1 hypothetical protein [Pseudomonas juntendi]MCQ1993503.1 hypothetical protein [Pseudomonas sp. Eb3]